jgi:hypothetical protein
LYKFDPLAKDIRALIQQERVAKGSPKQLPCLYCGRLRNTRHPGNRICGTCKVSRPEITGEEMALVMKSADVDLPGPGTRVDTSVAIMNAQGEVIRRVPSAEFAQLGQRKRRWNNTL